MAELINEYDSGSDEDITAAILRGEVIGGVFDDETGKIIPANLVWISLSKDAAKDYALGEYRKPNGAASILIARVFPGRHTREWRLTEAAGLAGYEETEMQVLGFGSIQHRSADGTVTLHDFDESSAQYAVHVRTGESFMFASDRDSVVGAVVLSVVTRPFEDEYETIVRPSSSEKLAAETPEE